MAALRVYVETTYPKEIFQVHYLIKFLGATIQKYCLAPKRVGQIAWIFFLKYLDDLEVERANRARQSMSYCRMNPIARGVCFLFISR